MKKLGKEIYICKRFRDDDRNYVLYIFGGEITVRDNRGNPKYPPFEYSGPMPSDTYAINNPLMAATLDDAIRELLGIYRDRLRRYLNDRNARRVAEVKAMIDDINAFLKSGEGLN